jgi:hypothetical protein
MKATSEMVANSAPVAYTQSTNPYMELEQKCRERLDGFKHDSNLQQIDFDPMSKEERNFMYSLWLTVQEFSIII